jgi:hypothetical protein
MRDHTNVLCPVFASLLVALLAGNASAERCDIPAGKPGEGRKWFYVRLVATGAGSSSDTTGPSLFPVTMLLTTRSSVAVDPPGIGVFNESMPTKNCFASAVAKDSRALKVRGNDPRYQSTECNVGQAWRQHDHDDPYQCKLLPRTYSGVTITATARMADIPAEAREAFYNDLVAAALELPEAKRITALTELGDTFDVRTGVLGQRLLAFSNPTCHASTCIAGIGLGVAPTVKTFLAANKDQIALEELRDFTAFAINTTVTDKLVAKDVLFILKDPSKEAIVGGTTADRKKLTLYIQSRLPPENAKTVIKFANVGFDAKLVSSPAPLRPNDPAPQITPPQQR